MAARGRPKKKSNDVIDPVCPDGPIPAINNKIGLQYDLFLSVIANHSQLQQGHARSLLNGIAE
jgi:hypothetical protein